MMETATEVGTTWKSAAEGAAAVNKNTGEECSKFRKVEPSGDVTETVTVRKNYQNPYSRPNFESISIFT